MNVGLDNAAGGLPALLGVVLGVWIYAGGACWVLAAVALLVVAAGCAWAGRAMLHRWPTFGGLLIEMWILAPIAVMALATAFIIWFGLEKPSLPGTAAPDEKTRDALSAALVGAVTTYVAFVWTKDIAEAKGFFWPSTQFKQGMRQAYDALLRKPQEASVTFEAMFEDTVAGLGQLGWSFLARRRRAQLLADFLASDSGPL